MFTKELYGLTLASDVANGVFPNISASWFGNDATFVATLRALMYKRVPKEESIIASWNDSYLYADDVRNATVQNTIKALVRGTNVFSGIRGSIQIHSLRNTIEHNDAVFEVLTEKNINSVGVLAGFKSMPDMDKFLEQKKIRARFFIREELSQVLIFIENLDIKRWHLLQSFIPRYFPTYFKEIPLEDDELKLIKSLTNRYAPDYEEIIEEFAKKFDFRTQKIRKALQGYEAKFEKQKLDQVKRQIEDYRYRIQDLENTFRNYYQQIDTLTTTQLGLECKINSKNTDEESELLDYFLCNKALNLVGVNGTQIEFIVTTALTNFDPDLFDTLIEKEGSCFYRDHNTRARYSNKEMTDERIKRLMLAIFRDGLLKLKVCAAYRLDFGNGNYAAIKNYYYPPEILRNHTPNQHIEHFACLGNNGPIIRAAMLERDYVKALAACFSSATNINMTEAHTVSYFLQRVLSADADKVIEMPDGTHKTPLEAVKWLEEQDTQEK